MSTEHQESPIDERADGDTKMQVEENVATSAPEAAAPRKRPRLNLTADAKERKRGPRSAFGLVLGTLNRAKNEDKERNASEAAKKRQLIDQRLQEKLRKETDSVRRAEEAKKDKTIANRKEEDLQLKDSLIKLRRTSLPLISNCLCTSDIIPLSDEDAASELRDTIPRDPLAPVPRSHPPPIYYLPVVLTPAQESFLANRKAEVKDAAEQEWAAFREERAAGIEEIQNLRKRAADEDSAKRAASSLSPSKPSGDQEMRPTESPTVDIKPENGMDVDLSGADKVAKPESTGNEGAQKETESAKAHGEKDAEAEKEPTSVPPPPAPMQADDEDAVEY